MHWRRKWQPTPVFLPGESQGRGSLVGCRLCGRTESDTTDATQQQQQDVEGCVISRGLCNKSERERQTVYVISDMWKIKNKTNEYSKMGTDSQIQRTNYWLPVRRDKG